MNIVLMAGGSGTRLWPLSRASQPKQFLDLGTGKTLLEHTYRRARTMADPADIFIATTDQYAPKVRQLLPDIPAENMLLESARRDTAAAFAAVAIHLSLRKRSDQPTVFMWSDHVFTAEDEFVGDLKRLPRLVQNNPASLVIMGHVPTFPETGFGYIEAAASLPGEPDVFRVAAFKEKPDLATAEQYVAAGNYFWNMGYIGVIPDFLLAQLRLYQPALMRQLDKFAAALRANQPADAADAYNEVPKIAIDYALFEKATDILLITGDYGWSDVGNWDAVHEIFGKAGDHMPHGHHIHVDSHNNFIYNATGKAVSLIGLNNTIVVVTDDAILVTSKKSSHRVKEVVERLEKEEKHALL